MFKYLTLLFPFLYGCQGIPNTAQIGAGVAAGAGAAVIQRKVQEAFTPKFPLISYPTSLCRVERTKEVVCVVAPCEKRKCDITYKNWNEFLKYNENQFSVSFISLAQAKAVLEFCKKKPKECKKRVFEIEGKTFVLR